MVLNKRGLAFFYTFMLGTLIIVFGLALMTPVKQIIDNGRNSAELNCASPASDFDQGLCWILDALKFVYPALIIFIGVAIIMARRYVIG